MNSPRWTPGIGDPSLMGWLTVLAYFVAAFLCWRASWVRDEERNIWLSLAVALLALGINKQLDLQSWFTQVGRDMARAEGWYDARGIVQKLFIGAIALGNLMMIGAAFWFTRHRRTVIRVAMIGFAMLLAFILIRAASFHHVDILISTRVAGARVNWILELGGILIIALAARFSVRS